VSGARGTEPSARRGRKLRPLDPAAGPTQSFAAQLRELRRDAGDPSFAEMARRVHWGTSALAAAARGDRLPTWSVTEGFVQALDGDIGLWRRRWESAHRVVHGLAAEPTVSDDVGAVKPDEVVEPPAEQEQVERRPSRHRSHRPRRLVALVLLAVVTAAVTLVALENQRIAAGRDDLIASAEAARQADLIRSGNPGLALRLGLAAYRLAPTPEARSALWSSSAAAYPISLPGGLGAPVVSVASSPDGRTIAASGRGVAVARIWTVPDQGFPSLVSDLRASIPAPVAFSPVGHLLAAAGPDRAVFLWDVSRPSRPLPLSKVVDGVDSVGPMAFSPDGHELVLNVPQDRTVRLLDISDPTRPAVNGILSGGQRDLSTVIFSNDAHTIATADTAGEAKLWAVADRRRPQCVATIPFRGRSSTLAFSPTAPLLAVTGGGATELWDTTEPTRPTLKFRWPAPDTRSSGDSSPVVAFSADGRFLLRPGVNGAAEIVTVNNGRVYARLAEDTLIRAAVFNPGKASVVVGTGSGALHLWRPLAPFTATNDPTGNQWGEFNGASQLMTGIGTDGGLSLWGTADRRQPEVVASLSIQASGGLFTADGKTLITAGPRGVALWSVSEPRHPALLSTIAESAGRYTPRTISLLPGMRTLVLSAPDGSLAFWDVALPRRPHLTAILRIGRPGVPATFVATPARGILAVSSPGPPPTVRLVNASDPKRPRITATLDEPSAGAGSHPELAISGNGRVLAMTDHANLVHLWNIADPSRPLAGQVLAHTAAPGAMIFAPDRALLAVGGPDSAVHLWDVRDISHPIELIALPAGFAAEHLAFSPDGRLLVGGGENGTALLWRAADPRHVTPVGRITFSNSSALLPAVTAISFAPDGELLAVGLAARVQFLVDLDTDRLYHEYCALPNSRISREEWHRYLAGVVYRRPC